MPIQERKMLAATSLFIQTNRILNEKPTCIGAAVPLVSAETGQRRFCRPWSGNLLVDVTGSSQEPNRAQSQVRGPLCPCTNYTTSCSDRWAPHTHPMLEGLRTRWQWSGRSISRARGLRGLENIVLRECKQAGGLQNLSNWKQKNNLIKREPVRTNNT